MASGERGQQPLPDPGRRHLAFLHTSPVHVETFDRLARAIDPGLTVDHIVAEDLLADARRVGTDDRALAARVGQAMAAAAANGAAIVVCTCSTLGGLAERTPTHGSFAVARIDRAMADRAVRLGRRILVVAVLESTLGPTADLLRDSAAAAGVAVELASLLVAGAWSHHARGDRAAYAEAIAAAVRVAAPGFDAVVLAQASMAPATDLLVDLGTEVLSSPASGVQSAVAQLRNAG